MQPDLFGGVLLVKEWERIGAQGRMAQSYASKALAAVALSVSDVQNIIGTLSSMAGPAT